MGASVSELSRDAQAGIAAPMAIGGAALVLIGSFLPWLGSGLSISGWDVPLAYLLTGGDQVNTLKVGLVLVAVVAVVAVPLLTKRPLPYSWPLRASGVAAAAAGLLFVVRLLVEDGPKPDFGIGIMLTIVGGGLIAFESWRSPKHPAPTDRSTGANRSNGIVGVVPAHMASPIATGSQEALLTRSRTRHWWMTLFSLVTFGLGIAAVLDGGENLIFGLVMVAAVVGAGILSDLWVNVKILPIGPKILVWTVAIIGGAAASFFVVMLWVTLRLVNFAFGLLGVDLGLNKGPGVGSLLRRASGRYTTGRAEPGDGSDWDRILSARSVGGDRIVREGGFTYIGGRRVMSSGDFTYVGDDRVIFERGSLRIGDKLVTREGDDLFIDGQRVEE